MPSVWRRWRWGQIFGGMRHCDGNLKLLSLEHRMRTKEKIKLKSHLRPHQRALNARIGSVASVTGSVEPWQGFK